MPDYGNSLGQMAGASPQVEPEMVGEIPEGPGQQQMGGPGIDTPQEQKAVEMMLQGAQLFRQAAETDPSVRYIVDKLLQEGFLSITKHYGLEEEGKLALKQSQMGSNRARAMKLQGGGPPAAGGGAPY